MEPASSVPRRDAEGAGSAPQPGAAYRHGVWLNLLLACAKLGLGGLARSPAVFADGVHSGSDVAVNLAAWLGHRWSRTPPDEDHHYGHGNGQALAGLLIGLAVMLTGASLAAAGLRVGQPTQASPGSYAALAALLVSMAVKQWLALRTRRAARAHRDRALAALARDNQGDVLASLAALIGLGGSLAGAPGWVEPAATAVLGGVVLWAGWSSVKDGFDVLMDRVDPALRAPLLTLAAAVPGVGRVVALRIHPLGDGLRVDLDIEVDGRLTVRAAHDIAHAVEDALRAGHAEVRAVQVHVNPAD